VTEAVDEVDEGERTARMEDKVLGAVFKTVFAK
jgi:hypothetical protein